MPRNTPLSMAAAGVMIVMIVATLLVLEIMLHVTARVFPQVALVLFPQDYAQTIPDEKYILKGNPRYPRHDKNGFRNAAVKNNADVVLIGDSHTYGQDVVYEQTWPQILEALTSCDIYNMSIGGYGPLHYVMLAEEAIQFHPNTIFVGIYFGNDFFDNWQMYLRDPHKYEVPKPLLQAAMEREREKPLSGIIFGFFHLYQSASGQSADESNSGWSIRRFLSQYSSLWGYGRALKNHLLAKKTVLDLKFDVAVSKLTPRQLEYASVFGGTNWRTIFTSRYREVVENEDDPRIRVGYWLTEWAITHINNLAMDNSIRPVFVLFPTKESVFASKVADMSNHRYLAKLNSDENAHRDRLVRFMKQRNIDYVDLLPSLRSSTMQPYFENANGHPNGVGHEIVAVRLSKTIATCR